MYLRPELLREPETSDNQPTRFTPINQESCFTEAMTRSVIPEKQAGQNVLASQSATIRTPSETEAEALKARATTRKRPRAWTNNPVSRPKSFVATSANSLCSYGVLDKPCTSRTGDGDAVASPRTPKRPASIHALNDDDEDYDILKLVPKATRKKILQTKMNTEMQPPVGGRLSTPPDSTRKSNKATKKDSSKQKPKLGKLKAAELRPSGESSNGSSTHQAGADLASHSNPLPRTDPSKRFELSQATLSKLAHFWYDQKPIIDHSTTINEQISDGNLPKGLNHNMTDNARCPDLQESHLNRDFHVLTSNLTHLSSVFDKNLIHTSDEFHNLSSPINANNKVDDDFGWDDCMDNAVGNHLDLIENSRAKGNHQSISNPDKRWDREDIGGHNLSQCKPGNITLRSSASVYANRVDGNTEFCGQCDMDGDINDEEMLNLISEHENPGHRHAEPPVVHELYWKIALESDFEELDKYAAENRTSSPLLEASDLLVDEEFPPMEIIEASEEIPPETGANERFLPPSSLNYAFDDNSQDMEIYDSSLKGSTPPTEGRLTPEREFLACGSEHAEFGYHGEDIICDECTDQTSFAVDPPGASGDSCKATIGGNDEIIGLTPGYSLTSEDGRTGKCRIHAPSSTNFDSSSTSVQSRPTPSHLEYGPSGQPKPFVRPPYPKKVQDRSPIAGISPKTVLRTCFRVGEALRDGSDAVRRGQDAVIELYARVVFSSRGDKWKQYFQFADLFHDRPPLLSGTYEVFGGSDLWESDCRGFLGEEGKGKMCRCIGRIKRDGARWKLVVLNIWQATWDDVRWAKGIVCA